MSSPALGLGFNTPRHWSSWERRCAEPTGAKTPASPCAKASDLAHRCGAEPLEEQAHTELRATGARPRRAVYSGVDSLTPSELRVARMAAEGNTNREIAQSLTVTEKTIETHMRHVFQKLDVARRTELAETLEAD